MTSPIIPNRIPLLENINKYSLKKLNQKDRITFNAALTAFEKNPSDRNKELITSLKNII